MRNQTAELTNLGLAILAPILWPEFFSNLLIPHSVQHSKRKVCHIGCVEKRHCTVRSIRECEDIRLLEL